MIRLRLLLVVATMFSVALMANAYYWYALDAPNNFSLMSAISTILVMPAPFMFLSSLVMLAFSFLKVEEKDGMLVYDQKNPYWRIMSWICYWDGPISLCRAFWTTVFVIFLISMVLSCSILVLFMFQVEKAGESLWVLLKILAGFGTFAVAYAAFLVFVNWLINLSKSENKLVKCLALISLSIVAICFVTGFVFILVQEGMFLIIVAIIGFFLAAIAILRIISSLPEDNALTQMLRTLRDNLCPILKPKKNS